MRSGMLKRVVDSRFCRRAASKWCCHLWKSRRAQRTALALAKRRREVFEPRDTVEPFANAEDVAQLVGGEILVEHGETVAEIEVGFPRMLGGERATATW